MNEPSMHPLGVHRLQLVKVVQNKHGRISLIFRGLGENEKHVVLRTFSRDSEKLKHFTGRYATDEHQNREPLEQLRELRGSLFKVEITKANNPDFVNIGRFIN